MGLELEYDSGSQTFSHPEVRGWSAKTDGSLRHGLEFVIDPAIRMSSLSESVLRFATAWKSYKTGVSTRGGFHVHVQAHDMTPEATYRLVVLYNHFQSVIDQLVGRSRVNNSYCARLNRDLVSSSETVFDVVRPRFSSRNEAKYSHPNRSCVVNLNMMSCIDPEDRTIEFRQGSPSKRHSCIFGWAVFCHALVEAAKAGIDYDPNLASLDNLKRVCSEAMQSFSAVWIGEWIQWRFDEMNPVISDEDVQAMVQFVSSKSRPVGLFTLSKGLDWCYPKVKEAMHKTTSDGHLRLVRVNGLEKVVAKIDYPAVLSQLAEAAAQRRGRVSESQPLST